MTTDSENRRLAWCVALLLRHAPDPVVTGLLERLDPAARGYLCRDEPLPPSAVTLLLRHGSAEDRRRVAANPHVLGRPLPGLPGTRRYAARPAPHADFRATVAAELAAVRARPGGPEAAGPRSGGTAPHAADGSPAAVPADGPPPAAVPADGPPPAAVPTDGSAQGAEPRAAEPPPLTTGELLALLRRHGARHPRVPLRLLRLPHEPLDPARLLRAHADDPLPPGSVEALLLAGGLAPEACLRLLGAQPATPYGRGWHRPAVRAVRAGLLTPDEVAARLAPAHRALLLGDLTDPTGHRIRKGLRWDLPEQAAYRAALHRVLHRALGDDPRMWAELLRHAPAFPGTLPELAAAVAAGTAPEPVPGSERAEAGPGPAPDPGLPERLRRAAAALVPPPPPAAAGPERELALAALAVPNAMGDLGEDIRWVRACLDRSLITGTDVVRHKAPAAWALDEDHWLGELDLWQTFIGEGPRPRPPFRIRAHALLAARAEADRQLTAALGTDTDAWWRAALALPEFIGPLPELLEAVTEGGSVPGRS